MEILSLYTTASQNSGAQLVIRDPSDYCPGCNTRSGCVCPSAACEDAILEASYTLGLDHGAADGPENRPTPSWCADAGLDADEYLAGYDAGCARTPEATRAEATRAEAVHEPAEAYGRRSSAAQMRRTGAPLRSEGEIRAGRIAAEAERWLGFAGERSRMRPETVLAKAFQSACFSVQTGASSLAVPSKLVGVKDYQRTLWALVRGGYERYERLAVDTTADGVQVWSGDEMLGEVQPKHIPWVRPLVAFGLTVHLGRITGHETEGHTLGVNIVFGGVGRACAALAEALGSGDGASGDSASGDGAASSLRLVVPETTPSVSDDVVLWRDARGTAHASLGTPEGAPLGHVVRHSPTGIEWSYGGSGPSDLALSVLTAIVGAEAAERHYRALVAKVVSRVPQPGGVMRADSVRAWVRRQDDRAQSPTTGRAAA